MREKNADVLKCYEQKKVQNYLMKYIDELKLHFDIEQKDLEKILLDCYNLFKAPSPAKKFIDMVKSFKIHQ